MEFKKYVKSLLPNIEKKRVIEDIRVAKEELVENTIPPFESAAGFFSKKKFSSAAIAEFDKRFSRDVKTRFKGNFIEVSSQILKNAKDVIDVLEGLVDDNFSDDIAAGGLTYFKANVLQLVEFATFSTRYARKVLLWTLETEDNIANGLTDRIGKELKAPEQRWLKEHESAFFQAMTFLATKPADVEKSLENIPDIVIDERSADSVQSTVGLTKLDPYKTGFVLSPLALIYHIRINIAEWQVNRYKAAVEEKKMLELRLLSLKEKEKNSPPNPKLRELIEYSEARLEKLNYKIAKMEEKYG